MAQFPPTEWLPNHAFDEAIFSEVEAEFGIQFPTDYVEFMKATNGGEARLSATYLIIWPANHIKVRNTGYEIQKYLPNVVCVASDGLPIGFGFRSIGEKTEFVFFFIDDLDERLVFPISDSFLGAMEELEKMSPTEFYELERLLCKLVE